MATTDQRPRPYSISDILIRIDLGALLDELTTSAQGHGPGRRWHCPMPDHDDRRASVTMFRDHHGHERWRCWSSEHRGDAVDLVAITTGRGRAESIEWLAERAGVSHDRPLPPVERAEMPPTSPAVTMHQSVAHYVRMCARLLAGPQGQPVREWLYSRGFDDSTIAANLIGADPSRTRLRRPRGLPTGVGVAATFPAFDPAGNITYVQSRYLEPDSVGRKYDNPSASLAPHPRLAFPVTTHLRDSNQLVVCEGIPDALTAAQAGFTAVALLGAHTPDDAVAARIANHAANCELGITLVCDPDEAGRRVADVLVPKLRDRGADPTVITPPSGLDLNAWAQIDPSWPNQIDAPHAARSLESTQQLDGREL
jgi:DNA primase